MSNLSKKIVKKQRKHQHVLYKETGVTCLEQPSQHVAICNAGQINGLSEDVILDAFHAFGAIEQVVLIPGKSCCFITFTQIESAVVAFEQCNGKLNIAQDSKPVFLAYVEAPPQLSEMKVWNELPPGLIILEDFISEVEELKLAHLIAFDADTGVMKHRQVRHFGYEFRYDINNVDKYKPLLEKIPDECSFLWSRLRDKNAMLFDPDQLTVNHYKPGQGIPPHIDTHSAFEDPIVSLSLGSNTVMEFRKGNKTICVLLPRRSLTIMSGESRYDWTHGITPRKFGFFFTETGCCSSYKQDTRVSFTFRKVLRGECKCQYQENCDSYNLKKRVTIDEDAATKLESLHVHDVYEDIASHFSDTRHKPWPNVLSFVESFPAGSVLVDVGCGNGKYFGHNKNIYEIGLDRSFKLIELCNERGFETCTANCLNIPLRDSIADGVFSIAVIHHLANEDRRLQAIKEIVRVLRVGGKALIYVWAKDQVRDSQKSSYIKQDRKHRKGGDVRTTQNEEICVADGVCLPIHRNRTNFNHNDVMVPWKLKKSSKHHQTQTFLRFYHVFDEEELYELCKKLPEVAVIETYYDQGNYCIMFQKTQ